MKKKYLILIPSVLILIIVLLVVFRVIHIPNTKKNEGESTDKYVKILTESKKTQIYLLGDDIKFDSKLYVEKIDKLSVDAIENTDLQYRVIVINDISDKVNLSEDEINVLKDCFEKKGYLIEYLGKKYANILLDEGEAVAEVEGNLSYEYSITGGVKERNIGAWHEEDNVENEKYPGLLGNVLTMMIADYLQNIS